MSGFLAPARIATPMPERATSVRVAASIAPLCTSSSITPRVRMATSNVSPASISFCSSTATSILVATACPVRRVNSAPIAPTIALVPFELSTLSSAAGARPSAASATASGTAKTHAPIHVLMALPLSRVHHHAFHAVAGALERPLHEARCRHVDGEFFGEILDGGGPALGEADRDRHIVVAARQDARP